MKQIKDFEYYIEKGVIRKKSPDKLRSKDLIKNAEKSYKFLMEVIDKIGLNDSNINNIITNSYDIIIELIRAKIILDGFSASGFGAHEAEISYLKKLHFPEEEINFANQLRYFRNSITYYGKELDKEYAEKVLNFLKKMYKNLEKLIKNEK